MATQGRYHLWRSKFGGMDVSDASASRHWSPENARLKKKLLPKPCWKNERKFCAKKW